MQLVGFAAIKRLLFGIPEGDAIVGTRSGMGDGHGRRHTRVAEVETGAGIQVACAIDFEKHVFIGKAHDPGTVAVGIDKIAFLAGAVQSGAGRGISDHGRLS